MKKKIVIALLTLIILAGCMALLSKKKDGLSVWIYRDLKQKDPHED